MAQGALVAQGVLGQGLRADLVRLESSPLQALVDSLKRRGVADETIQDAIAEIAEASVGEAAP